LRADSAISIIEAKHMELLAIVVLGISTLVGFSTNGNKPKSKTNASRNDDPDWQFNEPYNSDESTQK